MTRELIVRVERKFFCAGLKRTTQHSTVSIALAARLDSACKLHHRLTFIGWMTQAFGFSSVRSVPIAFDAAGTVSKIARLSEECRVFHSTGRAYREPHRNREEAGLGVTEKVRRRGRALAYATASPFVGMTRYGRAACLHQLEPLAIESRCCCRHC
jgi:hypothetical protein